MKTCRLAVAIAGSLLWAGTASAVCTVGRLAELPVTMSGMQATVHVGINGADVRLMIDSGAFYSLISPGTARELKLPQTSIGQDFYLKGLGGTAAASVTTVKDFKLNQIPMHNVEFLVGGSEVGHAMGGLLGRNVLGVADAEYDLANGAIRLMRPSGCGGRAGFAYWAGTTTPFSVVNMLPDSSVKPAATVYVSVNGVRLRALLDSGSDTSVLFRSAAVKTGVAVNRDAVIERDESIGVGRHMVEGYSAPLNDFKIGDEEIKTTRIRVLDTSDDQEDLLLGADFFLSHRIYVSNSQKKIYFTYNGGPVFSLVATRPDRSKDSSPGPTSTTAVETGSAGEEPKDAAGFSRRGQAFAARHDFARALPDLDRAVTLAPDDADYLYQRAQVLLATGREVVAMADIDHALKLRPTDIAALLVRADFRFPQHDAAGSARDLDEIARLAPQAAYVRFELAARYERAEQMEAAVTQYSLWIANHPDDSRRSLALNGRCWARGLLNRDLDKALSDCNAAIRGAGKTSAVLDSRGLVFLRLGEFAKAIADYDASLELEPKEARPLYGRGLARLQSGDAQGGKADLASAAAVDSGIAAKAAKWGLKP